VISIPDLARFWALVDKSGPCWIWTGYHDSGGYGRFGADYKQYMAHRLSYMLEYGDLPAGMDVCHHCDNPACVRPTHLFKGTRADNMHDRYRKGRYGGLIIPPLDSLIPLDQQAEIRAIWSNPDHPPARELAQQFGVTLAALIDALDLEAA
jgi:hypothetical protein